MGHQSIDGDCSARYYLQRSEKNEVASVVSCPCEERASFLLRKTVAFCKGDLTYFK